MITTLSSRLRVLKTFWYPEIHDCLLLILIAILSMSNYITSLGFYEDDWFLLGIPYLSPDQSFISILTELLSTDPAVRPVYFLIWTISYKLFGLNPLGYQLLNGVFFAIGFVPLYFIFVALRQPRTLSLSICLLFMLMPSY